MPDIPIPFSAILEDASLPGAGDVVVAVHAVTDRVFAVITCVG